MFFILTSPERKEAALRYINMLNGAKPFSIEIKEYRKNRSKSQNRLYWSWIHILAVHTGYDDEELHEEFKVRLLGVEEKTVYGQKLIQPISTATLNTKQFTDYLTRIELVAIEMGVQLPHPDDYHYAIMEVPSSAYSNQPPPPPGPSGISRNLKGTEHEK
jgi:hypothetical protein